MDYRRKTKIICTLGPASESEETMASLIKAGMNVARFNFSHGSHEEHLGRLKTLRKLRKEMGCPVAALLDTKGPEIRLKNFKDGGVDLEDDQTFVLTTRDIEGDKNQVS
ncbi:MAG: pyruvate kinase, partial [Lachnospiraceae bacterium]|nr:pyruvate kinase [Lachnospiraceae bacterium]